MCTAGLRRESPKVQVNKRRTAPAEGPPRNSEAPSLRPQPRTLPMHTSHAKRPASRLPTHLCCLLHTCSPLLRPFLSPYPASLFPSRGPPTLPSPLPLFRPGLCSLLLPSPAFHGKGLLAKITAGLARGLSRPREPGRCHFPCLKTDPGNTSVGHMRHE